MQKTPFSAETKSYKHKTEINCSLCEDLNMSTDSGVQSELCCSLVTAVKTDHSLWVCERQLFKNCLTSKFEVLPLFFLICRCFNQFPWNQMTVKAEQRQKAAAVSSSAPRLSSLITSLLLCHSQLWSLPSLGLCRIKSFDVGLLRDTTVAPEPLSRSSATTHRLCDLPALRLPQALLTLWGAAACGVESLYNVQNQAHNRTESVDWKPGGDLSEIQIFLFEYETQASITRSWDSHQRQVTKLWTSSLFWRPVRWFWKNITTSDITIS